MIKLTSEQLIYLLCAKAYAKASEADTITKSDLKKSCLPNECKEKAEDVYHYLKEKKLIALKTKDGKTTDKKGNLLKKDGRFFVTSDGDQVLVSNLKTTDHDFTSSKSYKLLSAVLAYLLPYVREMAKAYPQTKQSEEMSFDEFQEKFKALYFEERKQQSLRGVVSIRKQDISKYFIEQNSISQKEFDKYFEILKTKGEISVVKGKSGEVIEWAE